MPARVNKNFLAVLTARRGKELKLKLFFKRGVGKKSDKKYNALVLDFGYRKEYLMLAENLIAEILGVSVRELAKVEVGEYEIGEISDNVDLSAKGV